MRQAFTSRNDDDDPHRVDSSALFVEKGDTRATGTWPVDTAWMLAVTAACQGLAGAALTIGGKHSVLVREFLRSVPTPTNPAQETMLRAILFDAAVKWARHVHMLYHLTQPAECSFAAADMTHAIWQWADDRRPKQLFVCWARRFWPTFVATHPPSAAERLARFFEENYSCGINVGALSRLVGCHHATLRDQFSREFGMAIIEYRNHVRIEHALILFAAGEPGKVVADKMGWKSRKNLYGAIEKFADVRPSEMTPAALADIARKLRSHREATAWHARWKPHTLKLQASNSQLRRP